RGALPFEPRRGRPAAPGGTGRDGGLAPGRAATAGAAQERALASGTHAPPRAHPRRAEPLPGARLRRVDRPTDGAAPRLDPPPARRRARRLPRASRSLAPGSGGDAA